MGKGKVRKIISEVHLYGNRIEALIKVFIWIISWIGGILVLLGTENKEVLGNAYFIYMLSLLMEFAPKIQGKTQFGSKLPHTILCFMMAAVCIMAASVLFGAPMPDGGYAAMNVLTIIIIAYMVMDSIVLWLEPGVENSKGGNGDTDSNDQVLKFLETLLKGNLGNLDGGAGSNG